MQVYRISLEYDNVTLFITDLLNNKTVKVNAMHRIVLSEGSNFDYERKEDPNTTMSRPSSFRQHKAIYMKFRWSADYGPTLNVGLVAL